MALRCDVVCPETTGLRWIYGENDGFPGLVLDGYDRTLVMKVYTPAWFNWMDPIQQVLVERFKPERLILRLSRNTAACGPFRDGAVLEGALPGEPVVFLESGIRFKADVLKGQKTGFFLDQRENRKKVEKLAQGRTVLNAFSYTGGFSLYAARGLAHSVTSIDQSGHALSELEANWTLNEDNRQIRACPHKEVQADVFSWLPDCPERYGLVVIDPPSLASRKEDIPGALKAYRRLAETGLQRTEPGGVLVCCSCSSQISREDFFSIIRETLGQSSIKSEIIEVTGHAPDHPEGIPELNYLKAVWIQVRK
jgi:23S rRNA (cytosine1962-C5)-methyltransferase